MIPPLLFFLLAACTADPPRLDAVTPEKGGPGQAIVILGDHFEEGVEVALCGKPLQGLTRKSPTRIEGQVAEAAEAGACELVVTNPDGRRAALPEAFTVPPQDKEEPCGGNYTAYSQFAPDRELVVIDRHYLDEGGEPTGKRQTLRIPFDEVKKFEVENISQEEGLCSAVFVLTTDGRRVLFDNSREVDLTRRAYTMGNAAAKPVDVVRDDGRNTPLEKD